LIRIKSVLVSNDHDHDADDDDAGQVETPIVNDAKRAEFAETMSKHRMDDGNESIDKL
jgi:hypothetical protein